MTVPSNQELQLLQTKPHNTKLYLSIYQPETVLACQLASTGTKGMTSLYYENVTSGSPALVESEVYTMLVGLTPGGDEKGKIRIRSASGGLTSGTIGVPINSHIDWAQGDYLTVLRFVEINPVYQRIIQDPSDPMNTLWYKYSDIAYSNQNTVLGSFICMGSHFAGFLENGQCNVFYSASGTYNLKGEALLFNWFFQGAASTGSSSHTPGYVSYTSPGHYFTKLTVTSSGSASDISYRFVSIYDKPGQGSSTPILQWEMDTLSGHRDAGGYRVNIKIRDLAYKNIVRDGALVVIFAEDWYGNTKQSIGGNSVNRPTIFFSGYIRNGTIQYNYQDGYIEFEVVSPTEIMRSMEGYAIDVTSSTDPAGQAATDPNFPSGWTLLLDMDVRRAIYHYLRWHSTTLFCTDFDVNYFGQDLAIEHFTSDRTSIYDAINTLIQTALYGEIVADRQGKIFAEIAHYATNNASGSFPTTLQLNKSLWYGDPIIEERQTQELSFIELGGIKYDGPSAGTFSAFLSNAPGVEPGQRGKMEQKQGLALLSQFDLNNLAGNIFAWKNSRYPNIDYQIAGNYRNFDIAPQELVSNTIQQTDTPRGITFNQKPFAVRGVNWSFDSRNELLIPQISVAEITQGFAGDTIEIPDVPPVEGGGPGGGGFFIPPIIVPPFPIIPTPAFQHQHHILYLHPPRVATDIAGSTPPYPTTGDIYWDSGWSGDWNTDGIGYYDPELMYPGTGKYINIKTTGYYFVSVEFIRVINSIVGNFYGAYSIRTRVNDLFGNLNGQIIGLNWHTQWFDSSASGGTTPYIFTQASGIGYYTIGTLLSFSVSVAGVGGLTLGNTMVAKLSLIWLSS